MLSLEKGKPIGKIRSGKQNGKIIYIDTNDKRKTTKNESESYSSEEVCDCYKCNERRCMKKPCCDNCPYLESSSEESDEYESSSEEELIDKIDISDGKVVPVPDIDSRQVVYIAGPSGSGKSTYAAIYLANYKRLFPDNDIIIFSRKERDPVLDKLKPSRFIIDESIVTNPIDIIKDLKGGACVLFDDTNTFQDDKIKKAVSKLMNDILEIGRSQNIYCVVTSHLVNPNERKDARTIWNEAHTITIFPLSGNRRSISYALKNYCGFDEKDIKKILKVPSRWVTVGKTYPMYILHEKGAWII
jgi:hypothetical protein